MMLYERLAQLVQARLNTDHVAGQREYHSHTDKIGELVKEFMPSGNGFDAGTQFVFSDSTGERLIFNTAFLHKNEQGGNNGWTEHTVTVLPSLLHGFTLTVGGKDREGIKAHIGQAFYNALKSAVE